MSDILGKVVQVGSLGLIDDDKVSGMFGGDMAPSTMPKPATQKMAARKSEKERIAKLQKYKDMGYESTVLAGGRTLG